MGGSSVEHGTGYYEIRLESIGGLGAHLAGQILAEAGVLGMGLNGAHFSSYGSEKKGSPVKSFVRLGQKEKQIRNTGPVREPDLVAVFHEALVDPKVTAGLKPGGTLVVNTTSSPEEVASKIGASDVRILTLDATGIAVQERTRVNTAMLGAIALAAPILKADAVKEAIRNTFVKKYPHLVEANLRTFDRGFSQVQEYVVPETDGTASARTSSGPAVGYLTAPIGGVLTTPGNTIAKNMGTSRQGFLPVLNKDLCANCGVCDLVCPDYCLVWELTGETVNGYPGVRLVGIDYQYCKGCLHCVQECPTGALTKEREIGDIADRLRVPLFKNAQAPKTLKTV